MELIYKQRSGHAVAQLVKALCYKPKGRVFDSDDVTRIYVCI
jgi:hypothetical protein